MVKLTQYLTKSAKTPLPEAISPPTTARLRITPTKTPQKLGGIGEEAVLKVLNSLVQDPKFSELADDQTELFFREITKKGSGDETVKLLTLATSKYQFCEILESIAKQQKKLVFSYQVRQILLAKSEILPHPKIGCIWA